MWLQTCRAALQDLRPTARSGWQCIPAPLTAVTAASPTFLTRLPGPTRAALLYESGALTCATTSELTCATGVSVPNASRQLAILREGGLVASRRADKHALPRGNSPWPSPGW
ncbi:winged helix-turn-helix domain-containing protein [Streptomyces sp. NBC_01283]|uniref:ArsR/SmtB family transcription factor n=1 Tax=Streptomyces sp. NBC_01283 TaxID=2903812 RepID=UPI00352CB6A4|nr:winged helix-turn-helix domain-containing protein [Streptomyces sp. NBC_01283]